VKQNQIQAIFITRTNELTPKKVDVNRRDE